MKALRCDYCGGFINPKTYKCEYCGTQYVKPDDGFSAPPKLIVAYPPRAETLGMKQAIDRETYSSMKESGYPVEELIRDRFAEGIAREIAKSIEIEECYNYVYDQKEYFGKIRILKPDYKFA